MMNHDGSQQYTFGYGLASTPQIQLQQQQQIQLQQHGFQQQQPQQILQHQGNPAIPAQNVFQLQVGGSPATALLQQNDQTASMAQHGIMSQPVIHASISVSLDNSKPLQGLNNMEAAMVYSQQNNGLKIITNSGNFVQQPEIHFQSLDSMGKSNVFDGGVAGAPQGNVGAGFGKQAFSGWIQRDVGNQQYSVGQNALPSFGHLWSHFQQHKTQVNIVQQHQQLNQFQSQPHQFQSHHHHPLGQPQQTPQFTMSGIQPVNSIQMIKVQPNSIQDQAVLQPTTHLIQQCTAAPLPNALAHSTLTTSSSLPKQAPFKEIQTSVALQLSQNTTLTSARLSNIVKQSNEFVGPGSISGIPQKHNNPVVTNKKQSKSVQRKLKPSHSTVPGMATSKDSQAKLVSSHSRMSAASDTVRIKPSNGKAFTESGPPKVTVTLDSLAQFPDKADSLPVMKVTEKVNKLSSRNHSNKTDINQSMLWQQVHSGLHEKKNVLASNHLTSSTGSSLDRPSSEDSNFSSPPYSLTPPNSIDSVFSPPSFTKLIPDVQMTSDLLLPSSSSSALPPPTPSLEAAISNKMSSTSMDKLESSLDSVSSVQTPTFTSSLMSASCCSIAITTTSVTSSSPRVKGDIAMAVSIHSLTPLSSPGVVDSKSHWLVDGPKTSGGSNGQKCIKVPYSWQRKLEDGVVVYLSPSGAVLASLDEIREYLLSHDTCKCGLECPFQLEGAFVFDPSISNLPWSDASSDNGGMANLCNHRREIMAMAAFHQSQTQACQVVTDEENALVRKRESAKSLNSGDDLVVSPPKKLRTSITNAVNKHAMLRHNSMSGGNSLSSPLSDSDNSWQKDDVFYPISTPPLSTKPTDVLNPMGGYQAPNASLPLSKLPGFQTCSKDGQPKGFSQNLVYSNHHPSQRLGAKGHHSNRNLQSQPHRHTPFSNNTPFLPSSLENQNPSTTPSSSPMQHAKSIQFFHSQKQMSDMPLPRQCKSGFSELKLPPMSTPNDSDTVFLPNDMDSKPCTTQNTHHTSQNTHHTKYKGKGGNSKAKKDKQKLSSDFACNTSKPSAPKSSPLPFPPTSVSFLENPTVFVAQQTAMINSSISSCSNIDCPSPDNSSTNKVMNKSVSLASEEEDADDNLDTSREEDEDHKANTDVESNKSFSDTTENNDSAYLSQTGSDQEKSDTVDGLDCLSKSDIYDFSSSEDQIEGGCMRMVGAPRTTSQTGLKLEDTSCKLKESCDEVDKCEVKVIDVDKEKVTVGGQGKNSGNKVKLKQNRTFKKKSCVVDVTCGTNKSNVPNYPTQNLDVKCETNSLNGDLSQLLASNNWNIPALQKVLAQHSAGDPERLKEAIQQVMTQITVSSDGNCGTKIALGGNLNNNNNNNAQNVTVFNSVAKEIKQQSNNNNTSKHVTNGKSTLEPVKDGDVFDQKNAGKNGQNIANINMDSKTMTSTAKGCVKLGEVAKPPPTYTRVFQSTSSLVGMPPNASISSSGVNTPQCSAQTSIIMNHGKPQVMSINAASTVPQVSMNVVTNVSKPLSQVISNIGLNQTMLQTHPFLSTPHSRATQLLNHPPPQNTQIMNTLSIPGLNNSLVIANPIQQASPSSVAQLSPAMAAGQILAQGQQPPLQQMSPSFVSTAQIPKHCTASMSSHPNLTMSNASIPIASNSTVDVTTGTIPQGALTANSKDILNVFTGTRTPTLNQNTPVANAASVYSTANQPVFVIPQAKPVQPVVQLVGSSQALAPASGLQGDVTQLLNQATISDQTQQLQNLIAASSFNPLGIQQAWNTVNLNAQQQQQQQQLQLLQLQQLMLPVLQNQNQALPGTVSACPSQNNTLMNAVVAQQGLQVNQVVDVKTIQQTQGFNNPALSPVAQAAFPNQIQQMASPLTVQVGSAAPNPSVATINSQCRLSNPVNILQQTRPTANTVPKPTPVPTVSIPAVQVATHPSSSSSTRMENSTNQTGDKSTHEVVNVLPLPEQAAATTPSTISAIPPSPKLSTAGKSASKSKSKSKKSDSSKVKDPQIAKDEEHIANAVNQILAQAVQQQRELSLAAQNQPPPPPKSRNRKRDSQARARAALQAKEQELGKIASISDDAVFHHQLQSPKTIPPLVHLSTSSSLSSTSSSSVSSQDPTAHLVNNTSSFAISSSQSSIRPSVLPSHSTLNSTLSSAPSSVSSSSLHHPHITISDSPTLQQHPNNSNNSQFGWQLDNKTTLPGSCNHSDGMGVKNIAHLLTVTSDAASSLRNSSLNPTMKVKPSPSGSKKTVGISLKEHLSSIVVTNKDKESGRRKGEENNNPKGVSPSVFGLSPSIPPLVALVNGDTTTTNLTLAADTTGNMS